MSILEILINLNNLVYIPDVSDLCFSERKSGKEQYNFNAMCFIFPCLAK